MSHSVLLVDGCADELCGAGNTSNNNADHKHATHKMEPTISEPAQVDLTTGLDTLYQLCCDEDAATSSGCAATAVSNLPCFTLSPDADDTPEPSSPPAIASAFNR